MPCRLGRLLQRRSSRKMDLWEVPVGSRLVKAAGGATIAVASFATVWFGLTYEPQPFPVPVRSDLDEARLRVACWLADPPPPTPGGFLVAGCPPFLHRRWTAARFSRVAGEVAKSQGGAVAMNAQGDGSPEPDR